MAAAGDAGVRPAGPGPGSRKGLTLALAVAPAAAVAPAPRRPGLALLLVAGPHLAVLLLWGQARVSVPVAASPAQARETQVRLLEPERPPAAPPATPQASPRAPDRPVPTWIPPEQARPAAPAPEATAIHLPPPEPAASAPAAAPPPAPLQLRLGAQDLRALQARRPAALDGPGTSAPRPQGVARGNDAIDQALGGGANPAPEVMADGGRRVWKDGQCTEQMPTALSRLDPAAHGNQVENRDCTGKRRR